MPNSGFSVFVAGTMLKAKVGQAFEYLQASWVLPNLGGANTFCEVFTRCMVEKVSRSLRYDSPEAKDLRKGAQIVASDDQTLLEATLTSLMCNAVVASSADLLMHAWLSCKFLRSLPSFCRSSMAQRCRAPMRS